MLPLRKVRAIIFDLDNTLVDSHIDYASMKSATLAELISLGADPSCLSESWTIVHNVRSGKRSLASRSVGLSDEEVDARINAVLTATEMRTVDSASLLPGVGGAISELKDLGMPLAVLTRGSRAYATRVMGAAGLDGSIGPIVCRDDHPLEEAKPHPLAMKRAAEAVGMAAMDCLYAGDHLMDMECARAAGALFVGVLTGRTSTEEWREHGCDLILGSVVDLPNLLVKARSSPS
jgi:phosphoglycolate phosphatase